MKKTFKKLTKIQLNCIEKCVAFEKCNKDVIQKNIDKYKCLAGYSATFSKKIKGISTIILLKPIDNGNYHKVTLTIEETGPVFKEIK